MMESEQTRSLSAPDSILNSTPSEPFWKALTGLRGAHCAFAEQTSNREKVKKIKASFRVRRMKSIRRKSEKCRIVNDCNRRSIERWAISHLNGVMSMKKQKSLSQEKLSS